MMETKSCPVCPESIGDCYAVDEIKSGLFGRLYAVRCLRCGTCSRSCESQAEAICAWAAIPRKPKEPQPETEMPKRTEKIESENVHESPLHKTTVTTTAHTYSSLSFGIPMSRTYRSVGYTVVLKKESMTPAEFAELKAQLGVIT